MTTEKDYVERLEKIIDKQDDLLSQFDAKFKQQDSLNEILTKKNNFLKEDIEKHKNLTRDMNKTVAQHKNVVAKLKKELEDQLKIQQDLHREYGEVIKQLTDDLEEEQQKNEKLTKKQNELINEKRELESEIKKLGRSIPSQTTAITGLSYYDSFNKSNNDKSSQTQKDTKTCPNCGRDIEDEALFCDSCGTKL